MQTNKRTSEIVDEVVLETKRDTRREMFKLFNILPWLLLVGFLGISLFYAYNQKRQLETQIALIQQTTLTTNLPVISQTNRIVYTDPQMTSNQFGTTERVTEKTEKPEKVTEEALKEMEGRVVSSVAGILSNLVISQRGISSGGSNYIQVVERPIERRVYTGGDAILAKSLNYNLEEEIQRNAAGVIRREFEGWDWKTKGQDELRERVTDGVRGVVQRAFDGFETYNKLSK